MKDDLEMILDSSINNYYTENCFDISAYPDESHEFSPDFERKMERLIKKQRRFYFPVFKTGFRRAFVISVTVIIMMFTAVMSVSALRRAFIAFVTMPFADRTDVKTVSDSTAPTEIERIYEPQFIPDGFGLVQSSEVKEICCTSIYADDTGSFDFTQWVKAAYEPSVNTEGQDMEPVSINGHEGFIIDMKDSGGCLVSWDNGDYILQISGTIDRDTALEIARSVNMKN